MLTILTLRSDNPGDFYPKRVQDRPTYANRREPLSLLSDLFIAAAVPLRMCGFRKQKPASSNL